MKLISRYNIHFLGTAVICAIISIMLIGCSQDQDGTLKTSHGYKMAYIQDVEGPSPKENDVILFGMKVFAKDSLLTSTFDDEYPQEFRWIPKEQRDKMHNPVIDAFEMMTAGDSAFVYLPADSLKGNKLGLKSGENLVYVLKINEIVNADDYAVYAQERQQKVQARRAIVQARQAEVEELVKGVLADYKGNRLGDQLIMDPSGLEYVVHEMGTGNKPLNGNKVRVNYYGVFTEDGKMFDNSFRRGEPFSFNIGIGQVIKGWDVGVGLLPKGSRATLFIPYEMGYGAAGKPPTIPENADLVFYVETLE